MKDVKNFCEQRKIFVPNMNNNSSLMGDQGSRPLIIMLHHYHVELLLNGVDMILQELNNRFNEKKFNFLGSIACFSPPDSFHAFGLDKLVMLSNFYPYDFSNSALVELEHQFKIHISDM